MLKIIFLIIGSALCRPVIAVEIPPGPNALEADLNMCYGGYAPDSKWVAGSSVSWNPESSKLPLLPQQAGQAAVAAFHKYMTDYMPNKVEAGKITLHQVGDQWCYTIPIAFHRSDISLIGTPFWACVHVRMDGVARVEASLMVTPEPKGLLLDRDRKKEAEQGGADQPATASESKSEGKDKPQPESKVAPR